MNVLGNYEGIYVHKVIRDSGMLVLCYKSEWKGKCVSLSILLVWDIYIYICQKPEDVTCFVHREIGKLNFTLPSDLDCEF
jgi:hypothetical protein